MHAAERDAPNNLHNISEDGHLTIEHVIKIQISEGSSANMDVAWCYAFHVLHNIIQHGLINV